MNDESQPATKREWALLLCALVIPTLLIVMTGCFGAGSRHPGGDAPPISGLAAVVANLSLYLSALATLGFVAFIVAAFWTGQWLRFGRAAAACLVAISACQFSYWYGKHVGWITWLLVAAAVCAGGVYVWLHLKALERKIGADLNRDGKVG